MTGNIGRTVRLFLVDGSALGMLTGEIMNWTGHVLAGHRAELQRFIKRPEVERTGVYLLYGPDTDDPDTTRLYIGESDHVGKRLVQHSKDGTKDWWERTCVITSKDQNITKAHARYLESRLLQIAQEAAAAQLENSNFSSTVTLPEADLSDMAYFVSQVRLVLPVLGIDFFRESPTSTTSLESSSGSAQTNAAEFELTLKKSGVHAYGREINGEFIVLKGSTAAPAWKKASSGATGYKKRRQQLENAGKIQIKPGSALAEFTEDIAFASPSAASATVAGRPDNGRLSWKVKGTSKTYEAWYNEKMEVEGEKLLQDLDEVLSNLGDDQDTD